MRERWQGDAMASLLLILVGMALHASAQPLSPASANATTTTQVSGVNAAATTAPAASPAAQPQITGQPAVTTTAPDIGIANPPTTASPPVTVTPTPTAKPAAVAPPSNFTGNMNITAPFDSIVSCLPFTIVIQSTNSTVWGANLTADASVKQSIAAQVTNGTLYLSVNSSFTTNNAIQLVVTVPATNLSSVESDSVGDVIINSGFAVPSVAFNVAGVGRILARGLRANNLTMTVSG